MPTYFYKLVTKEDKVQEGSLKAFSKRGAHRALTREGATMLSIRSERPSLLRHDLALPVFGFSQLEKIAFFRNLSMMTSVGLSLVEALRVLKKQVKSKGVQNAFDTMAGDVENGQRLSSAMAKFPKYFSLFLVETVSMSELAGQLSENLDRISLDMEKDYELQRKVISAMAYPIIVIIVMIVVVIGLVLYVLPEIGKLFDELKAPMPLPTKILLTTSTFVLTHPLPVVAALLAIILFFLIGRKQKNVHYAMHYLVLRVPVFGTLLKEYNLVLFFRALESLLKSGVSLVQSVDVAQKTLKNAVYQKKLDGISPILLHGVPLSDALEPLPFLFPLQTQKIISVGEQTGKLEEMFGRITAHYERSVDHKTSMITVLLEPVLMVVIGIAVGGLALSIFLPIYQISTVI